MLFRAILLKSRIWLKLKKGTIHKPSQYDMGIYDSMYICNLKEKDGISWGSVVQVCQKALTVWWAGFKKKLRDQTKDYHSIKGHTIGV